MDQLPNDNAVSKHAFLLHHVVIVRRDLEHGLQTAQIIHAAGESALLADAVPSGTHAVALCVDDEAALVALGRALTAAGFPHTSVVENDAPYENQLMAIGIAPCVRTSKLKKIIGRLKKLS